MIELLIVVGVGGILLTLAMPGYRDFMLRTHRVAAIGKIMQIAACQERIYAARLAYDSNACQPAPGERYHLAIAVPEATPDAYLIEAVPQGTQAADPCGALRLDQLGVRSVSGAQADAVRCWAGR